MRSKKESREIKATPLKFKTNEYRTPGKTNERVSAVGLGCMGMSYAYGKPDEYLGKAAAKHFLTNAT